MKHATSDERGSGSLGFVGVDTDSGAHVLEMVVSSLEVQNIG